jgi:hypothetical protein
MLLRFAGTITPDPGDDNAEAPAVATFVNSTALFEPGGPNPPDVMFVQLRTVDQFVSPPASVQTRVPGLPEPPITVREIFVIAKQQVFVAEMENPYSPPGVLLVVVRVIVVVPGPSSVGGEKLAVMPGVGGFRSNPIVPPLKLLFVASVTR